MGHKAAGWGCPILLSQPVFVLRGYPVFGAQGRVEVPRMVNVFVFVLSALFFGEWQGGGAPHW